MLVNVNRKYVYGSCFYAVANSCLLFEIYEMYFAFSSTIHFVLLTEHIYSNLCITEQYCSISHVIKC
jgi:hypothetical protein